MLLRVISIMIFLFLSHLCLAQDMEQSPNILLITANNLGYSDLSCYGSEIPTPNVDLLASSGAMFTQFYGCGRSGTTLASLMTGQYPHRVGLGYPMKDLRLYGYEGSINGDAPTLAEYLNYAGYQSMAVGSWQLSLHGSFSGKRYAWPTNRGFKNFYGTIFGNVSYYDPKYLMVGTQASKVGRDYNYTEAIGKEACEFLKTVVNTKQPFFLYVAYSAPSWPLHAPPSDIERFKNRYIIGWDSIRQSRYQRMLTSRLAFKQWGLSPRDPRVSDWGKTGVYKMWQARRMEVYAAQVAAMDRSIGMILKQLRQIGAENNTLVIFLSASGATSEEISLKKKWPSIPVKTSGGIPVLVGNDPRVMPGPEQTFQSYGVPWANVSNTPFRGYANSVYEGAISVPCIIRWPGKLPREGSRITDVAHVIDIMPTLVDVSQRVYPSMLDGKKIIAPVGRSLLPLLRPESDAEEHSEDTDKRILYWESEGNRAIRCGKWKLVSPRGSTGWELYNMILDRTETRNLYHTDGSRAEVQHMLQTWNTWAERTAVLPWGTVQQQWRKLQTEIEKKVESSEEE